MVMPTRSGLARDGFVAGCVLAGLLLAGAARAGVSFRETITLSGLSAVAGGGAHENLVQVSGERRREDVSVKQGKAWLELERLGLSAPSTIARFDSGELLRIRPEEQEVISETWPEAARRMARLARSGQEALEFKDPVTELEATELLQVFAGIECRKVIVETRGGLVPAAGQPPHLLVLRAELWVATSFPGRSELEAFRRKEIERLGLDPVILIYRSLAPERYARAIEELGRGLARVDGVPMQALVTITNPLAGPADSPAVGSAGGTPSEGPGSFAGAGGEGMRLANAPTKLKMRTDLAQKYSAAATPTAPDWVLVSRVTELEAKAVEASRFEPPAAFRRLVPKSRRKPAVAAPAVSP